MGGEIHALLLRGFSHGRTAHSFACSFAKPEFPTPIIGKKSADTPCSCAASVMGVQPTPSPARSQNLNFPRPLSAKMREYMPCFFAAGGSRGRKPDSRPYGSGTMPPHCVPQAILQHPGERGAHGGKSEVSPRAPCAWRPKKTKHIPPGWQSALCNADTAGKECRTGRTCRTCRTIGTWCSESHVLRSFQNTWLAAA